MHLSLFLICLVGLNVTVTFSSLGEDVKLLLSKNDTLSYIAPPGIDPHMYQLTPRDVEKLKTSSLIISTSHVPFEIKIKELVNKGIIKAKLIEIPFIPNIKLKKNPALNQSILHMPIYDPNNYKTFIFYLANILAELNPKSALEYKNNAKMVLEQVNNITLDAPKLNVTGVGDFPFTPYAVSWLNLTISYLVVKEWGIPPTPKDLLEIEEKIKEGKIKIAVVTKSKSTPSKKLENLAKKYEIPILYVDSPIVTKSIIEKLKNIRIESEELTTLKSKNMSFEITLTLIAFILLAIRSFKKHG